MTVLNITNNLLSIHSASIGKASSRHLACVPGFSGFKLAYTTRDIFMQIHVACSTRVFIFNAVSGPVINTGNVF